MRDKVLPHQKFLRFVFAWGKANMHLLESYVFPRLGAMETLLPPALVQTPSSMGISPTCRFSFFKSPTEIVCCQRWTWTGETGNKYTVKALPQCKAPGPAGKHPLGSKWEGCSVLLAAWEGCWCQGTASAVISVALSTPWLILGKAAGAWPHLQTAILVQGVHASPMRQKYHSSISTRSFLWVYACLNFGSNEKIQYISQKHHLWQWGKAYPPCLSQASPLPGSCQLIHWVLNVIFPLHGHIKPLSVFQLYMFFISYLLDTLF